ncbi:MAG: DUF6804 family protein [bacterium]
MVGIMALVAVLRLPYGYYQLVRLLVFAVAVVLTIQGPRRHLVPVVLLGLCFNPFLPLHLTRGLWECMDAVAGGYLLWLAVQA